MKTTLGFLTEEGRTRRKNATRRICVCYDPAGEFIERHFDPSTDSSESSGRQMFLLGAIL